jgi:dihydroflavonol-4-reductase
VCFDVCIALTLFHDQDGLPVITLCPAEVYGANDVALVTAGNLKAFLNDPVILLPRTGGTSICAVNDVAAACVAAVTQGTPGQRYILGGPNVSMEQLAKATLRLGGARHARKPIVRLPSSFLVGFVKLLSALRLPTPVEPGVLSFAILYWYMDSSKAQKELGYQSRSVDDILKPAVEWLRDRGHFK